MSGEIALGRPQERVASERLFVYVAIVVGALAISLDFASIDLALPGLETQYGLDLESVQWVINGYVLAFAVFMVAGGRFADAYGRKNVFLIGMGNFRGFLPRGRNGWERGLGNCVSRAAGARGRVALASQDWDGLRGCW
jgi:MFS family permease